METLNFKQIRFVKYGLLIIILTTILVIASLHYLKVGETPLLRMVLEFFRHS